MPLGDGTGPEGAGPMTGRGAGTCASADNSFNMAGKTQDMGSGMARPRGGRGRGRGRGNFATCFDLLYRAGRKGK